MCSRSDLRDYAWARVIFLAQSDMASTILSDFCVLPVNNDASEETPWDDCTNILHVLGSPTTKHIKLRNIGGGRSLCHLYPQYPYIRELTTVPYHTQDVIIPY